MYFLKELMNNNCVKILRDNFLSLLTRYFYMIMNVLILIITHRGSGGLKNWSVNLQKLKTDF